MISRRTALQLGMGIAGVAATGGAVFAWLNKDEAESQLKAPEPPQGESTAGDRTSAANITMPMFRGNAARTGEMSGPVPSLDHPIVSKWTIAPDSAGIGEPVVANGMLFATGNGQSKLTALDLFTAQEIWNADKYGTLSDPVLGDGAVFVGDEESSVYAFEAATGRERWRTSIAGDPNTGVAAIVDQTLFLPGLYESLYAIDTTTGNERWSVQARLIHQLGGAIVVGNDTVFASTESEILAINADSGETRWTSANFHARALGNDTLFAVGGENGANTLHALDPASGSEHWRITLDQGLAELAVNDDSVFVSTSNYADNTPRGALTASKVDSGEEIWRFETESPVSSPLIVDEFVIAFCGTGGFDDGELVALDSATGEERWRLPTPGRVHSPIFVNGLVILRGKYMTAFGNLILPTKLRHDTVLRGTPSTIGINREAVSAGAKIDQVGAREETDGDIWVTVTVGGVTGWIPLDAIDPVTLPPEGEIWYVHNPT